MGFTTKEGMVRVDFFKESGKWYTTDEVDMSEFYSVILLREAVVAAYVEAVKVRLGIPFTIPFKGMTLVCLEPYHEHSYPIMVHRWDEYAIRSGLLK